MGQPTDQAVVGRCYTRARRLPLMIGRLPGSSGTLWGGPYTLTQLIVFAGGLLAMWATHGVWAHLGTGGNAAVLLGVPALAAWLVRHSRIDGRTPVHALLGLVAAVAAPPAGRLLTGRFRAAGLTMRRVRFFVAPAPSAYLPTAGVEERSEDEQADDSCQDGPAQDELAEEWGSR